MRERKNQSALTSVEWSRLIEAMKRLKDDKGSRGWDSFTETHAKYSNHENDHNLPHQGGSDLTIHSPIYWLPWHRKFVLEFEDRLRELDGLITIPYWNWTMDREIPAQLKKSIGGWMHVPRALNHDGAKLPTAAALNAAVASSTMEPFDAQLNSMHGTVHVWVGGAMAVMARSPRDPLFFLHHCFIDKVWSDWQTQHPSAFPAEYREMSMPPWDTKVAEVLSIANLGYHYASGSNETEWSSLGGAFGSHACVRSVTRDRNKIDLFAAGDDGRAYTSWWRDGEGWSSASSGRWSALGGAFPAGAAVSVLSRSDKDIDLFGVGKDGRIYTAWWRDGEGWSPAASDHWSSLGGLAQAGTPVAALSRSNKDIDLFVTGRDGHVYTASWRDGAGWSSAGDGRWSSLGGTFPAGAPVTVLSRSDKDIDLFVTGSDGRIHTAWWRDGAGWSSADDGRWSSIGGLSRPGAPVAAVGRSDKNIDLFITGNDGLVHTAWWRDGAGWSSAGDGRWSPLGGPFPAGAPVAALSRSNNDIDLFIAGSDGGAYTAWWRDGEGWSCANSGRWSLLGRGLPAAAQITAISRSRDDIDLFAVGADGHVRTAWWRKRDGWSV